MTQKEVSEIMFRVRTLEQIATAWQARSLYLQAAPVPEPGCIALLDGLAVAGAGFVRKRRLR